jgi:hypothetical protein
MYIFRMSRLPTLFLLTLAIVLAAGVIMNPTYAQRGQATDDPFVVFITVAGVDNSTGFVANWATANNITRAALYNASDTDLIDTNPNDGFVDTALVFPNGTIQVGDEYAACTIIMKDKYLTCYKGFNAPTNRAEFAEVLIPSSHSK